MTTQNIFIIKRQIGNLSRGIQSIKKVLHVINRKLELTDV